MKASNDEQGATFNGIGESRMVFRSNLAEKLLREII